AALVDDSHRNHERQSQFQFVETLLDGEERGLRVERVEDGLDEQNIHAALNQRAGLRVVGGAKLFEGYGPGGGVLHILRNGGGTAGGANGSGDEAMAAWVARAKALGGAPRTRCAGQVQLAHEI